MPLVGAHMSIAGGYYKAAEAAGSFGMQTVQIFTASPSQWCVSPGKAGGAPWTSRPILDEECRRFTQALKDHNLHLPCGHNSYLINLASAVPEVWERSVAAMTVEVERAEALGLIGLVMHPGSHLENSPEEGLQRVIEGIDAVHERTRGAAVKILVEATAGQGSNLGHRFEHLAKILDGVKEGERLGVCIDTCHIFAAGYPLRSRSEYDATFHEFDDVVGLDRVKAFHLNDSKKGLGSRVDRHEHIGEGEIGIEPFRWIMNDPRLAAIPMYLETKKEKRDGVEMDAVNYRTLKELVET
jgi:deoxyribonuclease-4